MIFLNSQNPAKSLVILHSYHNYRYIKAIIQRISHVVHVSCDLVQARGTAYNLLRTLYQQRNEQ